jgi:hypothetical protein
LNNGPRNEVSASIQAVFGGVRAEYFRDELFDLFAEPNYWPELRTPRPCFLVGGRGTGKTTVLRGLSYQGQRVLEGGDPGQWSHVGLYWRVDTNVVSAFQGASVPESRWTRIFGHYVNLRLVSAVVEFLEWAPGHTRLSSNDVLPNFADTCTALSIPPVSSLSDFARAVKSALITFESAVNNIDDDELPKLSVPGRPIQELLLALGEKPALKDKTFYILVDEYESLADYQQRSINTLVKHAGDANYTFKIGVKETGHRERSTVNLSETLVEPADYVTIDITRRLKDRDFSAFALEVCNQRMARVPGGASLAMKDVLPSVSLDEEAQQLGGDLRANKLRQGLTGAALRDFESFTMLQKVFAGYWAGSQGMSLSEVVSEFVAKPSLWRDRINNHGYAMLFTLRRGLPGRKKLYAGFDTYAGLADGNIRYLLQLVGEALQKHTGSGNELSSPVSAVTQTDAAQEVGLRALKSMPGASAEGAQMTKLVLSLGRVFGVMASQPEGHAPEVNQFRVEGREDEWTTRLLDSGVMHLALIRFPGDKRAGNSGETREWNYQLHPILSPYFVYSHRRKRRLSIDVGLFRTLVDDPTRGIKAVLDKTDRQTDEHLPEQLTLFGGFYGLD